MTDAVREFTIKFDDVEYKVVAEGNKITVNGRTFTVKVGENSQVLVDGIAYDVMLEEDAAHVDDQSHVLEATGMSIMPGASGISGTLGAPSLSTNAEGKDGAIVAMMPGKVTRVLVEEGQDIQEGEAVCVLEAMKMENELRAERDGVVEAVHVSAGDDVEKGQALVEIG